MTLGSLHPEAPRAPVPPVGTRVHIAGEPGTYVITAMDTRRHTVNVVSANGGASHFGIHLSAISLVRDRFDTSLIHSDRKLINEILGSESK